MTRYDEHNWHIHGSYAEETTLSSKVNDTDEDESKEIIMHESLSQNQSKERRESECNIVHETLLQNNSADIPDNGITELKEDEHKEASVTAKETSYFNIFQCGTYILDQLDITYQRAFMESPVQEEYYTSPAQERYYNQLTESFFNSNVRSDGTINNDKSNQAITDLKDESKAGHERNINYMTQRNEYKLPGGNKYASTVNGSKYYNLDDYEDEISDPYKKLRQEKSQSQIPTFVTHQLELQVSSQPSMESE